MQNQKKLCYIIVTYNGEKCLPALINSLLAPRENILIVDNNSSDNTVKVAKSLNCKIIENKKNLGYGAAINQGINLMSKDFDYFFILNQDVILKTFDESKINLEENKIVQPLILLQNGNINVDELSMNVFGFIYPKTYNSNVMPKTKTSLQFFSGSAFIISKKIYEKVGEFDESLFLYYEDCDYGIRSLLKNVEMELDPEIKIIHDYKNSYITKDKKAFIYKNRHIIINRYFKDIWRKLLFIKKLPGDKYAATQEEKEKFAKIIKPHLLNGFFTPQIPFITRTLTNLIMIPYSLFIKLFF